MQQQTMERLAAPEPAQAAPANAGQPQPTDGLTVAGYLLEQLSAWGVKRIYDVIGDANLYLLDALAKQNRISYIACRHEESTALMASAEAVLAIAEALSAALVTTLPARPLVPNDHALYAGGLGQAGSEASSVLLAESDLVVMLGATWWPDEYVPTQANVLQIDRAAAQIGRGHPLRKGIVGGAARGAAGAGPQRMAESHRAGKWCVADAAGAGDKRGGRRGGSFGCCRGAGRCSLHRRGTRRRSFRRRGNPACLLCSSSSTTAAMERNRMVVAGLDTLGSELANPDFAKLAESCGAVGYRADTAAHLEEALRQAFSASAPVLIDVRTAPVAVPHTKL